MRTLFDLTEEAARLFDRMERHAEESGGEVLPELEAEIEQLAADRVAKVGAICSVYKEMDRRAEVLREEAEKLRDRAKAARNSAEALKAYLQHNLKPDEKIEVGTHRVGWRKSSSVELMPGVVVEDIPELFQRRKIEFNREEAKRGIASGEDLWFAQLVEKKSIQIG